MHDFVGNGIYVVVDALGGLVPYRVEADLAGGLVMFSDNGHYGRHALTLDDFRGHVAGKVVVVGSVVDRRLTDLAPFR